MKVPSLKPGLLAMLLLLITFLTVTEAKAVVDVTPPTGTVLINNGAIAVNTAFVTLNLSATDDSGVVTQMMFTNDNVGWSGWTMYAPTASWMLTGGDGINTVYVQFMDDSGNISQAEVDTIILDQMLPVGTISINAGAYATNSTAVTLTLSAADNIGPISQMRFSSDNIGWSEWTAYATTTGATLLTDEGIKIVYVQFVDAAGNVSTAVSDTIILDQTSPTGTILINNGAASTNSTAVTFNLSAADNSGTVSQMRFSYDNVGWSAWSAYAATKVWTLSAGDGLRTVYVQFKDGAGNISTSASDTITLDSTRPTGTISINNGAASTNSTAVTFNLSATDSSGAVSQMRFSYDNVGWSPWSAYVSTQAWTLTAGDGIRTVYAQFKDASGNVSTAVNDTIVLDQTTPPSGTVSINNGAPSTNSTAVILTLSATDNSGTVSNMRFSYDNVGWSAWSAYAATKGATLTGGDGVKTIYVQFRDAGGNVSTAASDTIRLDRIAPVGTLSINNGAVSTDSTAVTLTLSATANGGVVTLMRLSDDNANWSSWTTYATTQGVTLTIGEGVKTIYAQFMDGAGNVSISASDTIMLDQTAPAGTVSINNGAASANLTAVTLNLSATDNSGTVSQVRFSHDNAGWSAWSAYATTKGATLTGGDGVKTIYVQFKDAAGNVSTAASDTIRLDQTRPTGTVSINNGAPATNSTAVTLTLSSTDNSGAVSEMRVSYDNVGWSAWSAYAATKVATLTGGDGVKTVYVQFKDAAGNVSTAVSDTITLDLTTPPIGTVLINNGAVVTSSTAVTLNLSATDNSGTVSQMRFSYDNVGWSAWSAYAATKGATLAGGDGVKTIYAQFKDAGGNVSTSVSDTIRLDRIAPVGTVSINAGAAATNSTAVTLNLSATDNNGEISLVRFSNDNVSWTPWTAYAPARGAILTGGDGVKTIYVQFMDAASNVSTTVSDTIMLDQTLPVGTVSINNGAASTDLTAISLSLSATDNSGAVSQMRFSYDNVGWAPWSPYAATKGATLTGGDGVKTIYVQFKDASGNVSTSVSDTIMLDRTPPVGTVSINNGAVSANLAAVTLTLSATDNSGTVSQMRFSYDNVGWSAWSPYATTKGATLTGGDGVKTIYVQFRDALGYVSASVSDTIIFDRISPVGTISIDNGAASANSTNVTLNLSAMDNSGAVSQMRFSNDNVGWSAWENYASTKAWTLTAGDGVKTVYVQFKNATGNVSATSSDTIEFVLAFNVSGTVIDSHYSYVTNMDISINTTPVPRTATTGYDGRYIFYNVPVGSYQLTPSPNGVNGALFSPAARNITVGANHLVNEDFRALVTYSISGTVNYAGTKTGRVYLTTNNDFGTSIAAPGAFTIRGLERQGAVTINAYMDHVGDTKMHGTNPVGSANIPYIISNITGVSITLTDPAPYVPAPPQIVSVSPSERSALISWNPPYDSNGKEASESVYIYYSTSPSVSPTNGTRIGPIRPMDDKFMYHQSGLVNGSVFYYVMTSKAEGGISVPSNVIGPVTIGPRAGGSTVSGTVTASGFTPTGNLIVLLYDKATETFYHTNINSPAASQPYSITGVPNGTFAFAAIYDMNNNHRFDGGDLSNFDASEVVTVTSFQTWNTTIAGADMSGRVNTSFFENGSNDYYRLIFDVNSGSKYPVNVTVVSGPNMAGPLDIGRNEWGSYNKNYLITLFPPLVGDLYTMNVTYSDGTTAIVTRAVTGVLNTFIPTFSPRGSVPGATTPTFTWYTPIPALPNAAGYRINVTETFGNKVWRSDPLIPMTEVSAQFNFDGSANIPSLVPGTLYYWQMHVEDQFGNRANSWLNSFTP